jgi:hypothetical protein
MNSDVIDLINRMCEDYIKGESKDKKLLEMIGNKLQIMDYQAQFLKYKLLFVPDPDNKIYDSELKEYEDRFSHKNALTVYHLVIPLLLYLFENHKMKLPAYECSIGLMEASKVFLREGDFAKHKTGGIRFITNTRFASNELRKFGLLRSDKQCYHKIWELSLFGLAVAAGIYKDIVAGAGLEPTTFGL